MHPLTAAALSHHGEGAQHLLAGTAGDPLRALRPAGLPLGATPRPQTSHPYRGRAEGPLPFAGVPSRRLNRVTETVRFRSCGAPPCLPCSRPARLLGCSRSAAGTREVSAGAPRVILGGRVVGSLLAPAAAASAVCQPPAARSQSRPFRSRRRGGGGAGAEGREGGAARRGRAERPPVLAESSFASPGAGGSALRGLPGAIPEGEKLLP